LVLIHHLKYLSIDTSLFLTIRYRQMNAHVDYTHRSKNSFLISSTDVSNLDSVVKEVCHCVIEQRASKIGVCISRITGVFPFLMIFLSSPCRLSRLYCSQGFKNRNNTDFQNRQKPIDKPKNDQKSFLLQ
jgi:hypothetical protein